MNAEPLLSDLMTRLPESLPVDTMLAELAGEQDSSPVYERAFRILLEHLLRAPEPSFCLIDAACYLQKVERRYTLKEGYSLAHFELWLNAQPQLDHSAQLRLRAKIAGKWLPRHAYQCYYPIGLGNAFSGSHIVTAHTSPDLDTCVASFWSWIDAFAAKVGEQLHSWNLPGGSIAPQDRLVFDCLFGPEFFSLLAKSRSELTLSALDLVAREAMILAKGEELVTELEDRDTRPIVLVGDSGEYIGEWRAENSEAVDQIIALCTASLQFVENQVQSHLIALLSHEMTLPAFASALQTLWELPVAHIPAVQEASPEQKKRLLRILQSAFQIESALTTTLDQVNCAVRTFGVDPFRPFQEALERLKIFNPSRDDALKVDSESSARLHDLSKALKSGVALCLRLLQRLDVQMHISQKALHVVHLPLSSRVSIEEVRQRLLDQDSVVVVYRESAHRVIPLGAILAKLIHKTALGSVSQRDFCNHNEVLIPPYLQVISAWDHHRADLATTSIPTCTIADVQSCNVLLAEAAMALNARYGALHRSSKDWQEQMSTALTACGPTPSIAALDHLREWLLNFTGPRADATLWYVHPNREIAEYLCMLHAIFDDTDLLTKVTARDARCVMNLLNRLKSLQCKRYCEIVTDCDVLEDQEFAKKLAERILQHPDAHSLYERVYAHRAKVVDEAMCQAVAGGPLNWFNDTKEQGDCARVGQSKLLPENVALFLQLAPTLLAIWVRTVTEIYANRPTLTLHLYMCSTISGAEEAFSGKRFETLTHCDQLWIFSPLSDEGKEDLTLFFGGFSQAREVIDQDLRAEIYNDQESEWAPVVQRYFPRASICGKTSDKFDQPAIVLFLRPGSINSRKVSISPYVPTSTYRR